MSRVLRPRPPAASPRRRVVVLTLLGMVAGLLIGALPPAPAPAIAATASPTPLLAYYYIWFDPKSWDRAKTDLPELGPYSSDNPQVMRQHIRWAKEAGIDGFIVSWKSTDTLNRRLKQLIQIADAEHFKLAIIYQGLDFNRDPLPATQVASDLDYFLQTYAADPAFAIFARPLVIWSGTWKFSHDEIAQVAASRNQRVLLLASEKNITGYERLADLVGGNAYYWSSVNPDTFPNYDQKLNAMAEAIHAHNGLWIAPAAPGFDARLVGGTQIVERNDGATLRKQMDVAAKASPDAIGLISWNEFSENSYVEPSKTYGRRYLQVLADIRKGTSPTVRNLDSRAAGTTGGARPDSLLIVGVLACVVLLSLAVLAWRSLRKKGAPRPRTARGDEEPANGPA